MTFLFSIDSLRLAGALLARAGARPAVAALVLLALVGANVEGSHSSLRGRCGVVAARACEVAPRVLRCEPQRSGGAARRRHAGGKAPRVARLARRLVDEHTLPPCRAP